jgi:hypothetical protein
VIDQDRAEEAFGFAQDVLQGFFHVLLGVGEGDDADGGGLPDVVEVKFGDGDVEFAAQTVFKAAKDLALVLERVRVWQAEFENEQAYGHFRLQPNGESREDSHGSLGAFAQRLKPL